MSIEIHSSLVGNKAAIAKSLSRVSGAKASSVADTCLALDKIVAMAIFAYRGRMNFLPDCQIKS